MGKRHVGRKAQAVRPPVWLHLVTARSQERHAQASRALKDSDQSTQEPALTLGPTNPRVSWVIPVTGKRLDSKVLITEMAWKETSQSQI